MTKCIGCGYCCTKATCIIGCELHGDKTPCPELMFAKERHWCRWVMSQELVSEDAGVTAAKALDIGAGCCSSLNTWRHEEVKDRCADPRPQLTVEDLFRGLFGGIR